MWVAYEHARRSFMMLIHSARVGESFNRKKEIFLERDVYVGDLLLGRPEAIAKFSSK